MASWASVPVYSTRYISRMKSGKRNKITEFVQRDQSIESHHVLHTCIKLFTGPSFVQIALRLGQNVGWLISETWVTALHPLFDGKSKVESYSPYLFLDLLCRLLAVIYHVSHYPL
jgi:hypothetical protein